MNRIGGKSLISIGAIIIGTVTSLAMVVPGDAQSVSIVAKPGPLMTRYPDGTVSVRSPDGRTTTTRGDDRIVRGPNGEVLSHSLVGPYGQEYQAKTCSGGVYASRCVYHN
jgi:hypothetical protein